MSKSALKILETAERLFNRNSFVAVGVDLIRDESGCSKTTMYTYYKNKTELIKSVLSSRDERFKKSLFQYIGSNKGSDAINKIFDWHMEWFQQDYFKGCLFVRVVAESTLGDQDLICISKNHKQWIKDLISEHCLFAAHQELSELIYTIIEGLISRFMIDGFDPNIANNLKKNINNLLTRP